MTKQEYLGLYAEGWTEGDLEKILQAIAQNYQFGDPEKGAITREEFPSYFSAFKEAAGQPEGGTFMDLSGIIAYEVGDKLIACCTWKSGEERNLVGNGLITVGDNGVLREDVVLL